MLLNTYNILLRTYIFDDNRYHIFIYYFANSGQRGAALEMVRTKMKIVRTDVVYNLNNY